MKEAVLSVKHGDGSEASKVSVKLTSENLIVTYLDDLSHQSPIPSTAIDSPLHSVNKESFSCQVNANNCLCKCLGRDESDDYNLLFYFRMYCES